MAIFRIDRWCRAGGLDGRLEQYTGRCGTFSRGVVARGVSFRGAVLRGASFLGAVRRIAAAAVAVFAALQVAAQPVKTGIEVLRDSGFELLKGKRVGLVTNPTGVDSRLVSTIDILDSAAQTGLFRLVALYGPEHGVRGNGRVAFPAVERVWQTAAAFKMF